LLGVDYSGFQARGFRALNYRTIVSWFFASFRGCEMIMELWPIGAEKNKAMVIQVKGHSGDELDVC
jgi:hypothetical protein